MPLGQISKHLSQKVVAEPLPEPPGSAPGGPRRPQEAPRAPQDSPKRRQERPKSRQEPLSERPGWPPGAHLAPKRPPEASRKPFWIDFGPSGAPFSRLPALVAEPSGAQAQTQSASTGAGAGASASASTGRKSQGHQAAKPQGLKDSKARRDVRSTLIKLQG